MQDNEKLNNRQRIEHRQNIPKLIASGLVGLLVLRQAIVTQHTVGGFARLDNPAFYIFCAVLWFLVYFVANHFVMRQEHAELLAAALDKQPVQGVSGEEAKSTPEH